MVINVYIDNFRLSYVIKVAVDSVRCSLLQRGHDIVGLVVYRMVEAQFIDDPLALVGGASDTDDFKAQDLGDLADVRSDCSGCSANDECFTRLWFADFHKSEIRGVSESIRQNCSDSALQNDTLKT